MAAKPIEQTAVPYAGHGSAGFNARMHAWLTGLSGEVRVAMGDTLVALILGGGYGRGEGGVLLVSGEEKPYNDLDFTLIVRDKGAVPMEALQAIRHKYERLIGIDVDFSRPLTLDDVRRWRPTLMWSDLLHGHIVLQGPPDILTSNAPAMPSNALPAIEATRLLLNRGAGLLWSLRVLRGREPAPDSDFVRRNYFKCALALGDALLISYGRFTTQYGERESRFLDLPGESRPSVSSDLAQLYHDALRFKFLPGESVFQPKEADLASLASRWGEVLLHVETRRSGRNWRTLSDYVRSADLREPEQNSLRHWPRNFIRSRQCGLWSVRYPRESLYRELPQLLELCGDTAPNWDRRSERFLAAWRRVN